MIYFCIKITFLHLFITTSFHIHLPGSAHIAPCLCLGEQKPESFLSANFSGSETWLLNCNCMCVVCRTDDWRWWYLGTTWPWRECVAVVQLHSPTLDPRGHAAVVIFSQHQSQQGSGEVICDTTWADFGIQGIYTWGFNLGRIILRTRVMGQFWPTILPLCTF